MRNVSLVLLLFALSLMAADITGTWTADVVVSAGTGSATFVFRQSGDSLSGVYKGMFGEAKLTGTVKENAAEWSFDAEQVGHVTYKGTVAGSTIKGSVEYGALGAGTFTAQKN